MNKVITGIILLILVTSLVFTGCSSNSDMQQAEITSESVSASDRDDLLYFASAAELEDALNSGVDVTGAKATFDAGITSAGPNSYILFAGKKLAFVSNNHPHIEPGASVTVKIISFENVEGVWNIEYER